MSPFAPQTSTGSFETTEIELADILQDMEAVALHISGVVTDERRVDGRSRFRASARFVGRRSDGRVTERAGTVDLERLLTFLGR